jgi:nickel/cobalt transporter (NicO) family protein
MLSSELLILLVTALSVGTFHTLLGPDHYIPFIAMAKARHWSLTKTGIITVVCGLGHVLSSMVLGLVGIAAGLAASHFDSATWWRGNLAGWLMTAFGFAYLVWGIHRAIRNRPHVHHHLHEAGDHVHDHGHEGEHGHVHETPGKANITPWVLFTIFVLGPCEPLIPILMYPAAVHSVWGTVLVTAVFAAATIVTMLSVVLLSAFGLSFVSMQRLQRFNHALAGGAIFACGVAINCGL